MDGMHLPAVLNVFISLILFFLQTYAKLFISPNLPSKNIREKKINFFNYKDFPKT